MDKSANGTEPAIHQNEKSFKEQTSGSRHLDNTRTVRRISFGEAERRSGPAAPGAAAGPALLLFLSLVIYDTLRLIFRKL